MTSLSYALNDRFIAAISSVRRTESGRSETVVWPLSIITTSGVPARLLRYGVPRVFSNGLNYVPLELRARLSTTSYTI